MTSSSNIPPGKSSDYLKLLRFCRTDNNSSGTADSDKLDSVAVALNSLPNTPLPVRALLPLIYRNAISSGIFGQLEPATQSLLKSNAMILVAKELANKQWLGEAIQTFKENSIPIILLKGAAFSGYLYSSDAPRPGVDIDFLVKRKDFDKACDALGETMNPVILAENRLATHRTLFERVYVPKTRSDPIIEIHRGLTNPHIFTIDEGRLWAASEMHPRYKNESIRILSPEDTLLHLAVHAFRDMNFCNHNLLDTHQLIYLRGINEEALYRRASDWGAKAILYYLLLNSRQYMGTNVQSSLLDKLEPGSITKRSQASLLKSSLMQVDEKSIGYRTTQITSQILFPDNLTSALRFQAHYVATRLIDLISR